MFTQVILLGVLTVTSYRATPAQTRPECVNNHQCQTSIGENVSELGVAVSQDLLLSGRLHYHDVLWIPGYGYRTVFDTMNARHKNAIDIFVYTKAEEHRVGTRHIKVYKVEEPHELQELSQSH